MSKNSNDHSMFGVCLKFFLLLSLLSSTLGSMLYLDMKPKDKIKEEIIKKGNSFTVNNNQLKEYTDVLDNLEINYTLKKSSDSTNININR